MNGMDKLMAKVIRHGSAKPNDPIYSTGAVIGGKRLFKRDAKVQKKNDPGDDRCPICRSRETCGHELAGWGENGKLEPAGLIGGALYDTLR